jgi:hypothetical protein
VSRRSIAGLLVLIGGLLLMGTLLLPTRDDPDRPDQIEPTRSAAATRSAHLPSAAGVTETVHPIDQTPKSKPKSPEAPLTNIAAAPADVQRSKRTQVQERLHTLMACLPSAVATASDREQLWRMTLPPDALEDAAAKFAVAEAWARQTCAQSSMRLSPAPGESDGITGLWSDLSPDDPLRRLWEASAETEVDYSDPRAMWAQFDRDRALMPAMRTLLEEALAEALREPSILELQSIADAAERFRNRGAELGPFVVGGEAGSALWRLAACDLGADCGPNSPAAHLICYQEQLCGYGSLEEALIDAYWPLMQIDQLQAARQQLVERLRAGGHGVFDPAPPGGG